jgi:5'-nucleotidase
MLILLDMDGVLTDFERGFFESWRTLFPEHSPIAPEMRRLHGLVDEYPPQHSAKVRQVYIACGFFRNLQPMPGAIDGVRQIVALGHDIRICTAPLTDYTYCVPEKYEWIDRYLGRKMVQRMILTKDKTLVRGDILVDDKPEVTGACEPEWEHVLYDQPFNRHLPARRMTWRTWQQVLVQPELTADSVTLGR